MSDDLDELDEDELEGEQEDIADNDAEAISSEEPPELSRKVRRRLRTHEDILRSKRF